MSNHDCSIGAFLRPSDDQVGACHGAGVGDSKTQVALSDGPQTEVEEAFVIELRIPEQSELRFSVKNLLTRPCLSRGHSAASGQ